jgi:hypothetical protein
MRTGLIAFAASAIIAIAIPASIPASAQDIGIHAGEGGVGVHVGDDHRRDRDRDHWRESHRVGHEGCRTTTVKHRGPDGTVIIRKSRQCD